MKLSFLKKKQEKKPIPTIKIAPLPGAEQVMLNKAESSNPSTKVIQTEKKPKLHDANNDNSIQNIDSYTEILIDIKFWNPKFPILSKLILQHMTQIKRNVKRYFLLQDIIEKQNNTILQKYQKIESSMLDDFTRSISKLVDTHTNISICAKSELNYSANLSKIAELELENFRLDSLATSLQKEYDKLFETNRKIFYQISRSKFDTKQVEDKINELMMKYRSLEKEILILKFPHKNLIAMMIDLYRKEYMYALLLQKRFYTLKIQRDILSDNLNRLYSQIYC